MSVRMLTFDVVGTLVDFETGILECVRRAAGDGAVPDDRTVLEAFAVAEDEQLRRTPDLPFGSMLDAISGRLADRLGVPGLAGDRLRRSVADWPAFPDAPDALAELGRRYRLVALTNGDAETTAAMSRTLGDPFDDVVTAQDVRVPKPDPQVFAYCMGRQSVHGIGWDDVLHVAQSQYHDIGVAVGLGITTCWVERRRGRDGFGATPRPSAVTVPDLHVGTLADLVPLLDGR